MVFNAYDDFLRVLSDKDCRDQLKAMTVGAAQTDRLFGETREIGRRYQEGLTELFFGTDNDKSIAFAISDRSVKMDSTRLTRLKLHGITSL